MRHAARSGLRLATVITLIASFGSTRPAGYWNGLAPNAFGVDNANNLVRINTATPGTIVSSVPLTGLQAGETIVGLDFRPANEQLFGLGSTGRLYAINQVTGAATQVGTGTFAIPLSGTAFGFDFDATNDWIRVVSDADQNLRLNPNDGTVMDFDAGTPGIQPDANLAYGPAPDPNTGANPTIVASAYSNNFVAADVTTLYGIDSALDILVRQVPPNNGVLNTVGPLGVDASDVLGFDIQDYSNVAFASLVVGGVPGLYTIDLVSGAATLVGPIGAGTTFRSLAIAPRGYSLTIAAGFVVTFTGSDASQTLRIDTAGDMIRHNRYQLGDPGFESDIDVDPQSAGEQSIPFAFSTIRVDAGFGDDTIVLGSPSSRASALNFFPSVSGGFGHDRLIVDDSSNTAGREFILNANSVSWVGAGPFPNLTYILIESLDLLGGSGPDLFRVAAATTPTTNISGLGGDDQFVLASGVSLSGGVLDGGPGVNTLDYSAFATDIAVDLSPAAAQTALVAGLSPTQEPSAPFFSVAIGRGLFTLNPAQSALTFDITFFDMEATATVTGAHFHNAPAGVNGPIVRGTTALEQIDIFPPAGRIAGTWTSSDPDGTGGIPGAGPLTPALVAELLANRIYFNIHSVMYPLGELRGQLTSLGLVGPATGTGGVRNISNVTGGSGNDTLTGSATANTLRGGAGTDLLIGGPGADTLQGEAGADTMVWNNGDGSDIMEGGAGLDTVLVNGAPAAGDVFTIAPGPSRILFQRISPGPFTLDIGTSEILTVNGLAGDDSLAIGSGGTVDNLAAAVTFDGGAGMNSLLLDDSSDGSGDVLSLTPTQAGAGPGNTFFGAGGSLTFGNVAALTVNTSAGPDAIALTPGPATEFFVNAGAPGPVPPGDTLAIDLTGAIGITHTPLGTGAGRVTFGNRSPVNYTGIETFGPTLSIADVSVTEGDAGSSNAIFAVTLSTPAPQTITIDYVTSAGTAAAGADYQTVSGTITFPAGELSRTIVVPIQGDTAAESAETFFVNLSNPAAVIVVDAQALGTILDNDPAAIAVNDVSAAEGNSGASTVTFTVTVSAATSGSVTVQYATADGTATAGSDYTAASGTLTFAPGETSKPVAITIAGDLAPEPNETLFLNLTAPTGATLADAQGIGTITNDDGTAYFLAEGATGAFFDLDIALANPNSTSTPATLTFFKEDGTTVTQNTTLPPTSRSTFRVDAIPGLEANAVSTAVSSPAGQPLLVERTMLWDATYYGSHTGSAVESARTTWLFAEGEQGFFDTYLLLANAGAEPATVLVRYLREFEPLVERTYVVAPTSRVTVFAGGIPELVGRAFSTSVSSNRPIVAERAMYFGTPVFNGGHESAGVPDPSTTWFHAEGATGPFFDTFLLVGNANPVPAVVTVTYLLDSGATITRTRTIPGNTRLTIDVETEDPQLAAAAFSTTVASTVPVVSERAMYWPGTFTTWLEGHNSFGVTATSTKWGLAEGRVGTPPGTPAGIAPAFQTFLLLANPSATAATVRVTFLRTAGSPVEKTYTVAPTSRFNLWVNLQVPELANETFGTVIESLNGVAIAVERSMYNSSGGVPFAAGSNANGIRIP